MILEHFAPTLGQNGACAICRLSLIWLSNLRIKQIIVYMNNNGSIVIKHP